MSNPEKLSPLGRRLLDRRGFLHTAGLSTSALALASMLNKDGLLAADNTAAFGKNPIRPIIDPSRPYASRPSHFPMPAKQVLVIYLPGAVTSTRLITNRNLQSCMAKSHPEFLR